MAGFTSGDGKFWVNLSKNRDIIRNKIKYTVQLRFKITQHSRDLLLLQSLIYYSNCGLIRKNVSYTGFMLTKLSDITY